MAPALAKSFPLLIHALCVEHHAGNLLAMVEATRIPYTTLWRWQRGLSRRYDNYWNVRRLCEHYRLEEDEVWALIRRDLATQAQRGTIPLPDLSQVRAGPQRKADSVRARRQLRHRGQQKR
jgi:hypothetical protein